MPIRLQGTVAFEPELVGSLTLLTRAVIAVGLDPDRVVIVMDIASAPTLPFLGAIAYDYLVFTGEQAFTVTEGSDARFLERFIHHIGDGGHGSPSHPHAGVFARLTRWMSPPA